MKYRIVRIDLKDDVVVYLKATEKSYDSPKNAPEKIIEFGMHMGMAKGIEEAFSRWCNSRVRNPSISE